MNLLPLFILQCRWTGKNGPQSCPLAGPASTQRVSDFRVEPERPAHLLAVEGIAWNAYLKASMRTCILYLKPFQIMNIDTKKTFLFWGLMVCVALSSCTSGPGARSGTAIGALGGAAAGGLMGKSLGGAAVGAGIGALGGNIIGGAQDERNRGGSSRR